MTTAGGVLSRGGASGADGPDGVAGLGGPAVVGA